MNFDFLHNLPQINFFSNLNVRHVPNPIAAITESSKRWISFDIELLGLPLLSLVPWVVNVKEKIHLPVTVNRRYQNKYKESDRTLDPGECCYVPHFRPYVAKVPWHGGARAFLSQLFPRYGHYCGPNWSSGRNGGLPLWDRRPIDWLDFCCYCHDIGYDTDDQDRLLKADLAFLECLERPRMTTKGNVLMAQLYKTMCITGLRNILIPYRRRLVRLQEGKSFVWVGSLNGISVAPWLGSFHCINFAPWLGSLNRRNVAREASIGREPTCGL